MPEEKAGRKIIRLQLWRVIIFLITNFSFFSLSLWLAFSAGFFERFPAKNSGDLIAGDAPLVKRKPRDTFRDSGRDYTGRYFVISIPAI